MGNSRRHSARVFLPVIFSAAALGFFLWNGQANDQDSAIQLNNDIEKRLNIYNWADYIDPQTLVDFEQDYGIEVNYDIYDSSEMVDAKLLTGRMPCTLDRSRSIPHLWSIECHTIPFQLQV